MNKIIKNYYVRSKTEHDYITSSLEAMGYRIFHKDVWEYLQERMKYINVWDDGDITWSDGLDNGDTAESYFNFSDYLKEVEQIAN